MLIPSSNQNSYYFEVSSLGSLLPKVNLHYLSCEFHNHTINWIWHITGPVSFYDFVTRRPVGPTVASSKVRGSQSHIDLYTQVTFSLQEILVIGSVLHSRISVECYRGRVSNLKNTEFTSNNMENPIYDWHESFVKYKI